MPNSLPPLEPTHTISYALGGLVSAAAERLGLHDFVRGYRAAFEPEASQLEDLLRSFLEGALRMAPALLPLWLARNESSATTVPPGESIAWPPVGSAEPTATSAEEALARVMRHAGPGARPGGPPTNLRDLGATQAQMNAATKPPSAS